MQELRSTDILDKEIQTEARKKAEKILQKADSDCAEILAAVDKNVENAKTEKNQLFQRKLDAFEKDQKASIPLEKERFEISFIQSAIVDNINNYLAGLSEEQRIEIVMKDFDFNSIADKKLNAFIYGFDTKIAKKILEKKLGKNLGTCQETIFRKIVLEDDCGLKNPEGIILETEDKSFRCRLTLSEVISHILDKDRAELSDALFGGQK